MLHVFLIADSSFCIIEFLVQQLLPHPPQPLHIAWYHFGSCLACVWNKRQNWSCNWQELTQDLDETHRTLKLLNRKWEMKDRESKTMKKTNFRVKLTDTQPYRPAWHTPLCWSCVSTWRIVVVAGYFAYRIFRAVVQSPVWPAFLLLYTRPSNRGCCERRNIAANANKNHNLWCNVLTHKGIRN